ncbi:NAD(P)/FAD-dependent oxidoreductase [Streptomyces sp. NPDC005774]|uniref:NAD(P)/FAD-dependent oxidoreductase n=1 Tax=Streptomyces TaxID=1883 RepID=UPI0033D5F0B5
MVVVGGSLGGVRVVQALRDQGYRGRVVLIGAETELPYDRPPLSKELLRSGDGPNLLITADQLAALDIEVRLGVRATALDSAAKTVTLSSGDELGFSSLVIATGSTPRYFPEWGNFAGVHQLRTFADCAGLREELRPGTRLVIVGAGFIGAEVAYSARQLGVEVVILDNTEAPLAQAIGSFFGDMTRAIHEDAGVELHHGITVVGFEGDARVRGVRLADGSFIEADTVLVCIGARPAVDWLQGSGLELENGVVCDATLTAAPDVYSIGDVSNFHNMLLDERMRVEHWTNVGEQAAYVAKVIATGKKGDGFGSLPFVWSEQFGIKIEVVGRPRPTDAVRIVEGSREDRQFLAVYERDGREVAAIAFNSPRSMFQLRRRFLAELNAARASVTVG